MLLTCDAQGVLPPIEENEPGLSSGLQKIESAVLELEAHGIAREGIFLVGFSQGACLTVEYAARHARRWGGVAALTGGLIGEHVGRRDDAGTFDGTPIFEKVDSSADFHRKKEIKVFEGNIPPGSHTITANIVVKGNGSGALFSPEISSERSPP